MDQPSDIGGLFSADRIVVVGANGAGKTWFAMRLATARRLPLVHHDALALTAGWVRRPESEVEVARNALAAEPAWILEGGPFALSGDVLARAEVIVWLDLPRNIRFWRVFWRTLRFLGQRRPEHPPGNREWPGRRQLRFLIKVWSHDAQVRTMIDRKLSETCAHVIRVTSPHAVNALVASLKDPPHALPAL
ncbi:MAG: hypothetical protein AAFP98_04785 [Pseudomonadota bacterium]